MSFAEIIVESKLESILAALVFIVFGIFTCWFAFKLGGLKFFLRFYGIKTTGTLTNVIRDHYNKAYRCIISYQLENGETIESEWPVLQHGISLDKKIGKTYTVYYNPNKTKEYDCSMFF